MVTPCLACTTSSKKSVRIIAVWCYCSVIVFSKLNKDYEYNS
ncbi:L-aspartate oxidase [Klebsiella oxytoca]|nr:L-aspartate oxidase [Klebsiella oxytoca]MBZ6766754.1 L-aspartate oxidase [Klebsiella oxytoca]MBZ7304509.1 L-aspartate oxidase [Klebsiella oxytoca]